MNLDLNTSMEDLYIGRGLYISEILDMYETNKACTTNFRAFNTTSVPSDSL